MSTETPSLISDGLKKSVRITQVSFGLTVNTGNYENLRFDLVAAVDPDQNWKEVLDVLKRRAAALKAKFVSELPD